MWAPPTTGVTYGRQEPSAGLSTHPSGRLQVPASESEVTPPLSDDACWYTPSLLPLLTTYVAEPESTTVGCAWSPLDEDEHEASVEIAMVPAPAMALPLRKLLLDTA